MSHHQMYWTWVEHEAALIKTDGCSKVSGAYRKHCRVHDLSYYYAVDPVDAFKRYRDGDPDYWRTATPITKGEADAAFRRGIQADSPLGFFSPMAAWRWLGLKIGGGAAWASHRQRETEAPS